MAFGLTSKEFESLLKTKSAKRYEYLIKKICDYEELWTLRTKTGFVVLGDNSNMEYIPIWPHPQFAEVFGTGEWENTSPIRIDLNDWIRKWIPGMIRDKRLIAPFPLNGESNPQVAPDRHLLDLQKELSKY